ncbi:MAG TPA: hypothetical protein PKM78_07345 [Anaerolineae bacterium]|nr:hypothetical protein [Anaerolineae bacterium]HNU03699.1 hypothetical protein [Anaerolineae bacterium]
MRLTTYNKVNLIAAYYFLVGGFLLMLAAASILIPVAAVLLEASAFLARLPGWFLGSTLLLVAGFQALLAMACLAIGWGLWQLKPWGRTWAMIAGVLQIPLAPIGTIAGGASLYLLLQDPTRELFLA